MAKRDPPFVEINRYAYVLAELIIVPTSSIGVCFIFIAILTIFNKPSGFPRGQKILMVVSVGY